MKPPKRSRLVCAIGAALAVVVASAPLVFAQSTTDGAYDQQARNFPGVGVPSNPASFFAPLTAAERDTFAIEERCR